jgi:cutinase
MKTSLLISTLLPFSFALPSKVPVDEVSKRSLDSFSAMELASANVESNDRSHSRFRARALGSSVQNDVKNGSCKPMTILFARGTTEQGNMGTLAGPPFVQAVGQMMGANNVAVQGIEYPADIPGFLAGGDANGSKLMAQMVGQVMTACPTTSLVIAGYRYVNLLPSEFHYPPLSHDSRPYPCRDTLILTISYSQGGQLVHNAASMLTTDQTAFVQSAVIFGDPNNGNPVGKVSAANTKVVCHNGDLICAGQAVILTPHLTYSANANEAAKFVMSTAGKAASAV